MAVEQRIAAEPVAHWLERLEAAGVPCGPVLARESVPGDAQVRANRLLEEVEQPGLGPVTMLGRIFRADDETSIGPAPALGAHTHEILEELGAT
jgi:crotonobetainyl-CoA:carnitine CoA-transferase CaiB-like acyl-CoA transferase